MKRPDIIGEIITDDITFYELPPHPEPGAAGIVTAVDAERGTMVISHDGENRRARRAAVANFELEGQPLLRRQLLEQRRRRARGQLTRGKP